MIDFGKDTSAFYPNQDGTRGSTIERFWDQYDAGEDKEKYSRPRAFANAIIEVNTSKGFLDLAVYWPDHPCVTRIVQPNASISYDV